MSFSFESKYGNGYGNRSTDTFNKAGTRRKQYNNYGPNQGKGPHNHDHYFYDTTHQRSGWAGADYKRKSDR